MAPHKYGRYMHILTPVGADGAHGGPQPWEGITGRVKQLVKHETDRLILVGEIQHRGVDQKVIEVDQKVSEVDLKLGEVKNEMDQKMRAMDTKMDAILELLKRQTE